MLIEQLDQLSEVRQRACEPVDLVDHHDGDLSGPDIREQGLQGGAVEGGTREAAIVVVVGDEPPALVGLTLDVGLAGLPLGIERVELKVKIMLGRLASVDRAAKELSLGWLHRCTFVRRGETLPPCPRGWPASAPCTWVPACSPSSFPRRLTPARKPKKRGPLQAVPVMARAMVERLGYVASRHTNPPGTTVTVWRSPWYSRTSTVPGLRRRGPSAPGLSLRARPSRSFAVFGSSPPRACSWMCQQMNRATRSLVRAGGGDDRNVVRHRVRSSSRPSDRTRSISASSASRSTGLRAMLVTPPCAPTCPCSSSRLSRRRCDRPASCRPSRTQG